MLSPSDSTHVRGNNDKETENLTASTARRILKGKSQAPLKAATEVEETLVISAAAVRSIDLYGENKEAGEEGEKYSSHEDVSLSPEQRDHGLSMQPR